MNGSMRIRRVVLILLLAAGSLTAITPAHSQTAGLERRDDRHDARDTKQADRGEAREKKAECNAGDEKTRAECRQEKRDVKRGGEAAPPK